MILIIIFNIVRVLRTKRIGGVPLGEDKPKSRSGANMAFNAKETTYFAAFNGIVYPIIGGKRRAFRAMGLRWRHGNKGGQNRHTSWGQLKTSSADNFICDPICIRDYNLLYHL